MKNKHKGRGPPKFTNSAGTRERGGGTPQLGRKTFVDEIIAKAESSRGSRYCPSTSQGRHIPTPAFHPDFETASSSVWEEAENSPPEQSAAVLESLYHMTDEASVVGGGSGPEIEIRATRYEIHGQRVTREEWDAYYVGEEGEVNSNMEHQGDNEEQPRREERRRDGDPRRNAENKNELSTLSFPIGNIPVRGPAPPMKNIPLTALPNFHGLTTEDPDEFLFEFDILCRSYDYTTVIQQLKLFPSTLKSSALRWFMSLGANNITSWDQMKQLFLNKYQDYCRTRDRREELFNMAQKEDESLEDFVERLQYNLHRSVHPDVSHDILKTILLKGVRDDCLDTLNMLGKGDISKDSYEDIVAL